MVTLQTGSARSLQNFHFRSLIQLFVSFSRKVGAVGVLKFGGSLLQVCKAVQLLV